ncbi:branched-chain amino acid transport system ATP-binding protein [Mesorhizobium soli]|uniref:ABC transporter ATP-binding protein n=1 Tax=Pseudaminobacter soli (ex Li et al. 2025) TaxID=1295366 RepID=UPI0024752B27|nr:ABC transporter ATP-binding protein [Mesorhizobium soli]MDH6235026.1 branched-chain amino acid transport system ATP-binding protein [Mesorhizobium soli]
MMSTHPGEQHRPTVSSLEVDSVVVDFQGLRAIEDVSLTLRSGEILGLIGPNGAGKTTLINVLTGFQPVMKGSVQMGGVDISDWKPHERSRRGLVRTFQGVLPFAGLTALENVEAGGVAIGLGRREARAEAVRILTDMGLSAKADRQAGTLPFGEVRRIGIARAIAMRPRFLLMDEPAAGLNDVECSELHNIIRGIAARLNCGILFIEHRMSLVFKLCDRVQVLQLGRTLAVGSTTQIRNDPNVRKAYLGEEAAAC